MFLWVQAWWPSLLYHLPDSRWWKINPFISMSHLSPGTWRIIIVPKASCNRWWKKRIFLSLTPGQNPMSDLSGLTIYNYRDHLKDLVRENCLPHNHVFYIESISLPLLGTAVKRLRLPFPWSEVKWLSHVRLFVTPWTVTYQALPSMGFSRQEYWSELSFSSPGDFPNPGIEPRSPTL